MALQKDTATYKVVVDPEKQYIIYPADKKLPLGWKDLGKAGTKTECLKYIEEVWTDRPLNWRDTVFRS